MGSSFPSVSKVVGKLEMGKSQKYMKMLCLVVPNRSPMVEAICRVTYLIRNHLQ